MALTIDNPELESYAGEQARAGGMTAEAYVERLIDADRRRLEALRKDLRQGFAELDRGEYSEYDDVTLPEFFAEVESEGLKLLGDRSQ